MKPKQPAKTLEAALLELAQEKDPQLVELVRQEIQNRPEGWKPLR